MNKFLIAISALVMPLSSTSAHASLSYIMTEVRFYSDVFKTDEIGGYIHYCDNTTITWGEVFTSHHYTEINNDCP